MAIFNLEFVPGVNDRYIKPLIWQERTAKEMRHAITVRPFNSIRLCVHMLKYFYYLWRATDIAVCWVPYKGHEDFKRLHIKIAF